MGLPRSGDAPIAAEEVPRIFDTECMIKLAELACLPAGSDLNRLSSDVQSAATIYARETREPDDNKLHHEIVAFYKAAERRQYERASSLRKNLSPQALAHLKARLRRPGPRAARLKLPSAADLLDAGPARLVYRGKSGGLLLRSILSRRDQACEMVETICRIGGDIVIGRMRPSGKRSRPTLRPVLHAPELQRHPPKRRAELTFVENLTRAWRNATGKAPARTASRLAPGPFVRFVGACLCLAGAKHANAVKLVNRSLRTKI
jgi:hypothetical protein